MEPFIGAILLAVLIEGTITYLFGESTEENQKHWLRYVSLAFGVVAAVAYQVDIFGDLGVTAMAPWIGYVTTGLIIGRGSNYVNDFISKVRQG